MPLYCYLAGNWQRGSANILENHHYSQVFVNVWLPQWEISNVLSLLEIFCKEKKWYKTWYPRSFKPCGLYTLSAWSHVHCLCFWYHMLSPTWGQHVLFLLLRCGQNKVWHFLWWFNRSVVCMRLTVLLWIRERERERGQQFNVVDLKQSICTDLHLWSDIMPERQTVKK